MTERRALVLVNGVPAELPSADTLAGVGGGGVNSQAGSTYTLALTDVGKLIVMTAASATVKIPAQADVAIPIGSKLYVVRANAAAGYVQVTANSGVTIGAPSDFTRTAKPYQVMLLVKRSANEWVVNDAELAPVLPAPDVITKVCLATQDLVVPAGCTHARVFSVGTGAPTFFQYYYDPNSGEYYQYYYAGGGGASSMAQLSGLTAGETLSVVVQDAQTVPVQRDDYTGQTVNYNASYSGFNGVKRSSNWLTYAHNPYTPGVMTNGGSASQCLGDVKYKGGDATAGPITDAGNLPFYSGGAAGTDGPGGNAMSGPNGARGPGISFTDSVSGVTVTNGAGSQLYGGGSSNDTFQSVPAKDAKKGFVVVQWYFGQPASGGGDGGTVRPQFMPAWEVIATLTANGSTTSFSFANIPQIYTDLRLVAEDTYTSGGTEYAWGYSGQLYLSLSNVGAGTNANTLRFDTQSQTSSFNFLIPSYMEKSGLIIGSTINANNPNNYNYQTQYPWVTTVKAGYENQYTPVTAAWRLPTEGIKFLNLTMNGTAPPSGMKFKLLGRK